MVLSYTAFKQAVSLQPDFLDSQVQLGVQLVKASRQQVQYSTLNLATSCLVT
jgi:hypothetical protein